MTRCAVCGGDATGSEHKVTGCLGRGQTVELRICAPCWEGVFSGQVTGFSIGPLGGPAR